MTEEFERPESRLSFINNKNGDLKEDLEKLSLLNDGDMSKVDNIFTRKNLYDEACKMEEEEEDEEEKVSSQKCKFCLINNQSYGKLFSLL